MSSKRAREDEEQVQQLQIKWSATEPPLLADRGTVSVFSALARSLQPESVLWDVSGLIIEGQAVKRQTVVAWLNLAYQQVNDRPFEQLQTQPQMYTSGLAQLLAFADAVGSSKGLLRDCLARLGDLRCEIAAKPRPLSISVNSAYYWSSAHRALIDADSGASAAKASADSQAAFSRAVAAQVEALLYLSYKLQLPGLQQKMRRFIKANTNRDTSLLCGAMAIVVSDRVVEVVSAANKRESSKQLVLEDLVTDCGEVQQLLKVVNGFGIDNLAFTGVALKDCLGLDKGSQAKIRLSLVDGESCIYVNGQPFPVQLLVGPAVRNPATMQRLMGPAQTAAAPAAAAAAAAAGAAAAVAEP